MLIPLESGRAIELLQGDITQQDTDAIVNAANSALLPGGGVCGAIHRAGGPAIAEECARRVRERGELAPGETAATGAGQLTARYVIHAVGPVWQGGKQGEAKTLAACYRSSIALADSLKLASIAFPSISTGIFGYPVELAAATAIHAVADALTAAKNVRQVRFVLFDAGTFAAYERETAKLNDQRTQRSA